LVICYLTIYVSDGYLHEIQLTLGSAIHIAEMFGYAKKAGETVREGKTFRRNVRGKMSRREKCPTRGFRRACMLVKRMG